MVKPTANRHPPPGEVKIAEDDAFAQVNALLLGDLTTKINTYPSMDVTDLLEHKLKTYHSLRQAFSASALESLATDRDVQVTPDPPADPRDRYRIPPDVRVISPLTTAVGESDGLSDVIGRLNLLIAGSEVLWRLGTTTAVLGLNSQLVLKVGHGIDTDHIHTMEYIRKQAPSLPIPEIHGILEQTDSNRMFMFMTRLPGEPLDTKWKHLNSQQKASIRDQLDIIVNDFRSIPRPSDDNAALLGDASPRRCKDARRQLRIAQEPISNESEFNDFISSNPQRTLHDHIAMIRSYLTTDHEIVMTHGDLHPRNIMVRITEEKGKPDASAVEVTGILDWEMCGWYRVNSKTVSHLRKKNQTKKDAVKREVQLVQIKASSPPQFQGSPPAESPR